ncbi:helix-turn-helix transcriptional regulator [bacterium RCC_150]
MTQLRHILNRRRAQAGLTLEQLAETSGVSRQTLLNLSSGRHYGDLKTWLKLSNAFGVDIGELLNDVWDNG